MADTKLNALTPSAGWTSTCSVAGSDSATPTGSFSWTKANFDAVYATKAAANTFTAGQTLSGTNGIFFAGATVNDIVIRKQGSATLEILAGDGSGGAGVSLGYAQGNQFLTSSGSIRIQDAGYIQITESAAPSGSANTARLFTQDLAGKTQLMVIFGSGVAQQIAIEL